MNKEIGVIRAQHSVASYPPRTIAAATDFAAELAQRYAPPSLLTSRADLTLALEPPAEINYYQSAPQVSVSPSVTIEETNLFSGVTREVVTAPADPRPYGANEARALFERLFSRHARVASFLSFPVPAARQTLAPGAPPAESSGGESRAQAVGRTLPGSAPANALPAANEEAPKAQPEVREVGWGSRPLLRAEPKPVILAAPEVRRVAEQVIREISHRAIAQRERMGRR
jgi:hypothetical protein